MTNYEKIKSFTIDEMAEWLEKMFDETRDDWESLGCYQCINYRTHHYPKDCKEEDGSDCEFLGGLRKWLERDINSNVKIISGCQIHCPDTKDTCRLHSWECNLAHDSIRISN